MILKNSKIITGITLICYIAISCSQHKKNKVENEAFIIRTGVNFSHWLSQSNKRDDERKNYISQADFDTIAALGFDHVRIPIDEVQLWDSLGNKQTEAFELLHNGIDWALKANLRVIVDMHIIRSHYFNSNTNTLWTDPVEQNKLSNMWLQLSEELKAFPNSMVAYEIMNEAVAENPDDWNKLFTLVLAELRKTEPLRKIVIGSNMWQGPYTFPDLKVPENDTNIILSFHFYTPHALTHYKASWTATAEYTGPIIYPGQIIDTACYKDLSEKAVSAMRRFANGYFDKEVLAKAMLPAIEVAKKYNLPLYCGEYGVYPALPEEIRLRWYKDVCEIFNENHIVYCHWAYKGDFPIVNKDGMPDYNLVKILTAK